MPESTRSALSNVALDTAPSGKLLVSAGPGQVPTAVAPSAVAVDLTTTQTIGAPKTIAITTASTPLTVSRSGGTSTVTLAVANQDMSPNGNMVEFQCWSPNFGEFTRPSYINEIGAWHTQLWVVISGATTGSGLTRAVVYPSQMSWMLGIYADILGSTFTQRLAAGVTTGFFDLGIDNNGYGVYYRDEAGGLHWGQVHLNDNETGWQSPHGGNANKFQDDTNLYRQSQAHLRTDDFFSCGVDLSVGRNLTFADESSQGYANLLYQGAQAAFLQLSPSGTQVGCNSSLVYRSDTHNFYNYTQSFNYLQINPVNVVSNLQTLVGLGSAGSVGAMSEVKAPNGSMSSFAAYDSSGNATLNVTPGGVAIGAGTVVKKVLSATATLDFPSTSAQSSADLTITVTGAAVGDAVSLGLPASPPANAAFTAWVSATDTVTVRFNNYSSGAVDPASGTYRATVFKF